jgi:hypothetical protein
VQVDMARPATDKTDELTAWAAEHSVEVHAIAVDSELRRTQALALGATVGRGRLLGAPAGL